MKRSCKINEKNSGDEKSLQSFFIQDYKNSGLSKSAWCQKQNLPVHQLYYWLRKGDPAGASAIPIGQSTLYRNGFNDAYSAINYF
ncbi:IS66 family insertion sequence element accessory protein TnpA [Peribacillus simplex]|uniref:IS66 family insertion sequence element accessory protein TnpA n=1 Tax=Peribacillus simplex TaxID=1478 RepID=UPI003D2BBFB3